MECKKKVFYSAEEANIRAGEINSENAKRKGKTDFRPYKCEYCDKWHLTSMRKHQYKYVEYVEYRNEINTKSFINRESEYWNQYYGVKN
jgi:hypothetical protein